MEMELYSRKQLKSLKYKIFGIISFLKIKKIQRKCQYHQIPIFRSIAFQNHINHAIKKYHKFRKTKIFQINSFKKV